MLFGCSLIALGVMAWLASNAPASQARIVVWGGLVANALGFCVALQRQLFSSTALLAGWVNVAIYLGFTAMLVWLLAAVRTKD